jgi:hypothetical protein
MSVKHNIDYSFVFGGDVKIWPGIKIELLDKKNKFIFGYIFLVDIDLAYDYEPEIKKILDTIEDYNEYDFICENKTSFLHDLEIDKKYRNNNFAQILRQKSELISKSLYYDYISSLTNKNNSISQHINKKLNYKIFKSNSNFDFFIKKFNF